MGVKNHLASGYIYVTDGQYRATLELEKCTDDTGWWRHKGPYNPSFIKNAAGVYSWREVLPGLTFLCLYYDYGGGGSSFSGDSDLMAGKLDLLMALSPQSGDELMPGQEGIGRYCSAGMSPLSIMGGLMGLPKLTYKVLDAQYNYKKIWLGYCAKGGASIGPWGAEIMIGTLINQHAGQQVIFMAGSKRVGGLGIGASGGLTLCMVTAVESAASMKNTETGGWDFNLAIGENWAKLLTSLKQANRFKTMAGALSVEKCEKLLKNIASIAKFGEDLAKNEAWLTWAKTFTVASGVDAAQRALCTWDTPISGGLEISCVKTEGVIFYSADVFDIGVIKSEAAKWAVRYGQSQPAGLR